MTRWANQVFLSLGSMLFASQLAGVQLPGSEPIHDFLMTGDLLVEVDGVVETEAVVYFSEYEVAYLLDVPDPVGLLLLSPRGASVQRVSEDAFEPEGVEATLEAGGPIASVAQFRVELEFPDNALRVGEQPTEIRVFELEGREVRLLPAPPLLGFRSSGDLEERFPTFASARSTFDAGIDWNRSTVDFEKSGQQVVARVYFRSDSKICRRILPKILAVARAWPEIQFEYYGLPRYFRSDPEASDAGLDGVPAIALIIDEERLSMVTGRQLDQPDDALLRAFEELGL